MHGPAPDNPHPMAGFPQVCFVRNTVRNPAIEIGDGAIVASRAVVASDVPPYAVVAGNPARVVKQRFSAEVAAQLQAIAWWHWPAAQVSAHLPAIMGADLAALHRAGQQLSPSAPSR